MKPYRNLLVLPPDEVNLRMAVACVQLLEAGKKLKVVRSTTFWGETTEVSWLYDGLIELGYNVTPVDLIGNPPNAKGVAYVVIPCKGLNKHLFWYAMHRCYSRNFRDPCGLLIPYGAFPEYKKGYHETKEIRSKINKALISQR